MINYKLYRKQVLDTNGVNKIVITSMFGSVNQI